MAPGKNDADWRRHLSSDLATIKAANISIIVCLLEVDEMAMLGMSSYFDQARSQGLRIIHLPVVDHHLAPLASIRCIAHEINTELMRGHNILIHCRSGLGRAGFLTGCVLTDHGFTPAQAIEHIRSLRPLALKRAHQHQCIHDYASLQ
jgi:ADP-ribosyl-[dinitrogen reductase] hydrolase